MLLLFWFFNTITNNLEFIKHCLHIRLNHLKLPFLRVKRPLNAGSFLEFNLINDFISYLNSVRFALLIPTLKKKKTEEQPVGQEA